MQKTFRNFSVQDGRIIPNFEGVNPTARLEPGAYTLHYNENTGQFWFEPLKLISDGILDLPSPEYSQVTREMSFFLKPEVKAKFEKLNYIYKRSCLLHGAPGTGKTIIVNRVVRDVVSQGGICLWAGRYPGILKHAFRVLDDIQPDVLTCVIMEEFDDLCERNESELLTLLDGQVQKHNVIYLATTNYLGRIPKRLYRPGRFSSVIEVKSPIADARRMYLANKLGENFPQLSAWTEFSNGLTIDELKEIVQACYILENPLEQVLARLNETRSIAKRTEDDESGGDEDIDEDFDEDESEPSEASSDYF